MTARETLEAIRDDHDKDPRFSGSYCTHDRLDWPCPARTAAVIGLEMADELDSLRDFDRRHYLAERDAALDREKRLADAATAFLATVQTTGRLIQQEPEAERLADVLVDVLADPERP